MSDHKSTQDLIGQIERKDQRFRFAQAVFMFATLVALIIVIAAQQRTLSSIKDQLVQAKITATAASKQSDDQRDKIIPRLDCVVVFFSQTDRTNLSIADIDKCSLNKNEAVQQFFRQPEKTLSENPPNLPRGSSTNPAATAQTTKPQPSIPAVPVPVIHTPPSIFQILGIPVCLPFTHVCVVR